MYTEGFEQLFKINKDATVPFQEWNKATMDVCKHLTEENLSIFGENIHRFSDYIKRLSNVRKPEDILNVQKDLFQESITAAMENTQRMTHLSVEAFEELTKLWSSTASKVAEKAVEKAQKHTAEK